MHPAQTKPKYLVCDRGKQFRCQGLKDRRRRKGIRPRFNAVSRHGSIAVVERFLQTLKVEATRRISVSLRATLSRRDLSWFVV